LQPGTNSIHLLDQLLLQFIGISEAIIGFLPSSLQPKLLGEALVPGWGIGKQ